MSGCGTRILISLIAILALWYLFAGSSKTVKTPKKITVYSTKQSSPAPSAPPQTPKPTKDDTAAKEAFKKRQEAFAAYILDTPGVIAAEWQSPISLWVKVDLYTLGNPPKERAKEVADIIADAGVGVLNQPLCIRVCYGNWNELAKSCRQ
ncbi:MAG TPA: hypothetical protein PKC29_01980 [Thermodesulfobacteriota bacterium]|nr:hypothetical protein [Thermodesulfobacteriota bacterium]